MLSQFPIDLAEVGDYRLDVVLDRKPLKHVRDWNPAPGLVETRAHKLFVDGARWGVVFELDLVLRLDVMISQKNVLFNYVGRPLSVGGEGIDRVAVLVHEDLIVSRGTRVTMDVLFQLF
jgi:hypothetical protein